jgi:hypothetical protein
LTTALGRIELAALLIMGLISEALALFDLRTLSAIDNGVCGTWS